MAQQETPRESNAPFITRSAPQPAAQQRATADFRTAPAPAPERPPLKLQMSGDAQQPLLQGRALPQRSRYKVLAQAHDSYLIVESPSGIRLIDQHALHERILYEGLKQRTSHEASQQLLIPAIVELTPSEFALFQELREDLAELGFVADEFGERTISIQATPSVLKGIRIGAVLRDCLAELAESGKSSIDRLDRLLKNMACKAAVKAGERLPDSEVTALLEKAEDNAVMLTCPHGRPCVFDLSLDELKRKFNR